MPRSGCTQAWSVSEPEEPHRLKFPHLRLGGERLHRQRRVPERLLREVRTEMRDEVLVARTRVLARNLSSCL